MSLLHHISTTNLISARCYGIEIDIDDVCAMLMTHRDGVDDGADFRRYETLLLAVLVHAWPLPDDPVVVALRNSAKRALKAIDKLTAQGAFSGAAVGG